MATARATLLSDLSEERLRRMLDDAERLFGASSSSADVIRRALRTRQARDAGSQPEVKNDRRR
jgi:hypothetical protein